MLLILFIIRKPHMLLKGTYGGHPPLKDKELGAFQLSQLGSGTFSYSSGNIIVEEGNMRPCLSLILIL